MRFALILFVACGDDSGFVDAAVDSEVDSSVDAPIDTGFDAARDAGDLDATTDAGVDATEDDAAADAGPSELDRVLSLLEADALTAEQADTLLVDEAWAFRWPLRDGNRYLFLTRWDSPEGSVSWVGDFNAFTPDTNAATQLSTGVHYWALVESSDDPRGSKYKWHANDVFRAPPESTVYGYDEFGEFGMVEPPLGASWFERFPELTRPYRPLPRSLRVRLPADFDGGDARVLLLHDGQNVFGPEAIFGGWRVDIALDEGFADVVAVAIDNAPDRFDAYTHTADDVTGSLTGGGADDYLRLLEDDVLPFVRERYGVSATGSSLMIAGSSLGGLVTLYIATERRTLAGCVGAMSSTLGWGAFRAGAPDTILNRWTGVGPAVYLDSGGNGTCTDPDGDGVQEDATQSDNYCVTNQLRDHLVSEGYEFDVNLAHWWEPDAPHNEVAWRARVPRMLAACADFGWVAL